MILNDMRTRIDKVDRELVRLLNKRAQIASNIASHKRDLGYPIRDFEREHDITLNIQRYNAGPIYTDDMETIYRAVLNACLRTE